MTRSPSRRTGDGRREGDFSPVASSDSPFEGRVPVTRRHAREAAGGAPPSQDAFLLPRSEGRSAPSPAATRRPLFRRRLPSRGLEGAVPLRFAERTGGAAAESREEASRREETFAAQRLPSSSVGAGAAREELSRRVSAQRLADREATEPRRGHSRALVSSSANSTAVASAAALASRTYVGL